MDPSEVERLTKDRERIENDKVERVKKAKAQKGLQYKKTFKPSGPQEYTELYNPNSVLTSQEIR